MYKAINPNWFELSRVNLTMSKSCSAESNQVQTQLSLPSWLKAHLERHPALYKKLEQGELVGISHVDQTQTPRPVAAVRSSILIFPVISEGALYGAIASDFADGRATVVSGGSRNGCGSWQVKLGRQSPVWQRSSSFASENLTMQSLLQMRAHLQSNIAHELRTPLAAVRGYTRMILDGRAGQANETQKEYLRVVADNTTRLINLVNWMSHVLEISADDFLLSRFDLRDVWKDCAKAAGPLKITEQIPDETFIVVGDRRKIARIFDHLLRAAEKLATEESKTAVQFARGREREITVKLSDSRCGRTPGTPYENF